jgi:sulfoacetaldehyde acetyltransferase
MIVSIYESNFLVFFRFQCCLILYRNFVTGVAAAFWAHSPVVVITPETGSLSNGLGGFQETNQLPIFSEITKFQAHVCSPKRMAELTDRCFNYAMLERGPVQVKQFSMLLQ